jgi:hypothetical protein
MAARLPPIAARVGLRGLDTGVGHRWEISFALRSKSPPWDLYPCRRSPVLRRCRNQ